MLTRFLPFAIFNEKQKKLPLCSILANSCHPLSLVCWWSTACAMSMYCLARTDCRSLSPFLWRELSIYGKGRCSSRSREEPSAICYYCILFFNSNRSSIYFPSCNKSLTSLNFLFHQRWGTYAKKLLSYVPSPHSLGTYTQKSLSYVPSPQCLGTYTQKELPNIPFSFSNGTFL